MTANFKDDIMVNMKSIKRNIKTVRNYVVSLLKNYNMSAEFNRVGAFCMFLGYPRSGHTLVSSLLDAHPDIVMANELNVLRYIRYGFNKGQIFYLIVENSHNFAEDGSTFTGYSYAVPNQWQGRFRNLRVIGDKRADRSVISLQEYPYLMNKLKETIDIPIKFIHVIRNPYDNISSMFLRGQKRSFQEVIDHYFFLVESVVQYKKHIPEQDIIGIYNEDIIKEPVINLKRLCHFLDVDAEDNYLQDCKSIVFPSPTNIRYKAPWTPELIKEVADRIKAFPFLANYTFEGNKESQLIKSTMP